MTTAGDESLDTKWQDWLDKMPKPWEVSDVETNALDGRLRQMLDPECKTMQLEALNRRLRKWVHQRCEQLGLKSSTAINHDQGNRGNIKNVTIDKPDGWEMPWDAPHSSKRAPGQRKKAKKEPRIILEECENCGEERECLYNWTGMGPLCEECIEADEEWSGHKWEPK